MEIHKDTNESGLSLIEILVVITIFAILGVLITQSIALTLQGTKKSESLVAIRENLDYSMSIIERQIRNANLLECAKSDPYTLYYIDQNGNETTFSFISNQNEGSYLASGSGRLTSDNTFVTGSFTQCNDTEKPGFVEVQLNGSSSRQSGIQNANVTINSTINLRNY